MSETAPPTVGDLEEMATTGTTENHSPILPAQKTGENGELGTTENHSPILPAQKTGEEGELGTTENHSPVAPAGDKAAAEGDDGVTTLENHSPIAPPKGVA
ncbi:hypothetical protein GCM10012287_15230 [Streptomyces daqingensis]|uniref:Sigma-like protein n=1 Tax=Streptomyces daqingensis TaxID=1472640 RepID=A0ABQ2M282_9ACTN|nr:hypothetical protein [Streptomyces daqingensis]GGO45985.1 hypothetical protein GCM10012287_15230 [Streptomyces daqingensis]